MMRMHVNPVLSMLIVFPIGAILGAINGFVVVVLRVNPLIATLGSYFTFRGLALQISNSMTISIPAQLGNLGSLRIGPVFVDILFAAVVLAIYQLIHTRTVFGRHVMAVGQWRRGSPEVGHPGGPNLVSDVRPGGVHGEHRGSSHHVPGELAFADPGTGV